MISRTKERVALRVPRREEPAAEPKGERVVASLSAPARTLDRSSVASVVESNHTCLLA